VRIALTVRTDDELELEIAMGFKTILVPTEQHDLMNSTLETALLLARKFDSYIEGFALQVASSAAFAMGDVGGVPIPALEQESAEIRKRAWRKIHARPRCTAWKSNKIPVMGLVGRCP
jgi:hypothetical protein